MLTFIKFWFIKILQVTKTFDEVIKGKSIEERAFNEGDSKKTLSEMSLHV